MPNLILYNAKLHNHPQFTAIAIKNGKIWAIADDADIKALAQPYTQQIDVEGRLVLPALSDAHFHFYSWCKFRSYLNLSQTTSLADLLNQVKHRSQQKSSETWLRGYGWNESEWPEPIMPTRHDLDLISSTQPIILWRADFHAVVVNSRALTLATIDKNTTPPPDGIIERDENGEPNGILKELAIQLVRRVIPSFSTQTLQNAIKEGINALYQLGITGLHDQRGPANLEGAKALKVYQTLHQNQALKLRLCTNIHHNQLEKAAQLGLKSGFGDDYLRLGFVKLFADGSMGAHTAWMLEPYQDGGLGMSATPLTEITNVIYKAIESEWPVSIHAIGDRANREILNIFEATFSKQASNQSHIPPHRIEHAQLLHPTDIPRFAKLGITASMQPLHLVDDMVLADRVWGERSKYAYPFRSLIDSGASLAFGSDCPVVDPNPWLGIHAAVNRCSLAMHPQDGWYSEQRLTVNEAIHAYTLANAIAIGQQNKQGSLNIGKLADLIIVNQDIFNIEPSELAKTQVITTIFDGEVVYER